MELKIIALTKMNTTIIKALFSLIIIFITTGLSAQSVYRIYPSIDKSDVTLTALTTPLFAFNDPELVPLRDQLGAIRPVHPSCGAVEYIPILAVKNIEINQLTITSDRTTNTLIIKGDCLIERVELIDMSGRRIFSVNKPTETIALNGIANGIYLVHVYTSKGEEVKKISIN